MPAKNLRRINEDGIYLHIYNTGIEKRAIFNEEEDYQVFLNYLKEYLTDPRDHRSVKKSFEVRGHTFQGTPHQPKNYFNHIELLAYSLLPDHFHLILHQKTRGSLEKFIRSLCTRYSMYFNKKYQRSGSLFAGPYKSVQLQDKTQLSNLTAFLHKSSQNFSSYPEYLGARETSWIQSKVILSEFDKEGKDYKNFLEKFSLNQENTNPLRNIILENQVAHLERRLPTSKPEVTTTQELKTRSDIPNFLAMSTAVFLLLVIVGVGNIKLTEAKKTTFLAFTTIPRQSTTTILGTQTEQKPTDLPIIPIEATPSAEPSEDESKKTLIIKIDDPAILVNIRQEPTTDSAKVDKAYNGEVFEFISENSGWYEVKIANELTGFISADYVETENKTYE
jgi:putative transposase